MNDNLETIDGLCVKIIEQRDRIWALEAALREITAMDPKAIRADDLGRAARIARAALAPEQNGEK